MKANLASEISVMERLRQPTGQAKHFYRLGYPLSAIECQRIATTPHMYCAPRFNIKMAYRIKENTSVISNECDR
jgi:hypothetical protein